MRGGCSGPPWWVWGVGGCGVGVGGLALALALVVGHWWGCGVCVVVGG